MSGCWRSAGRALVLLGLCLAGALLSGCAFTARQTPVDCAEGEEASPIPWRSLAPGVWVWEGARGDIAAENQGHVAPTSLVVDAGEAAVIDPGPSFLHGERVRRSVACRFQARVRWVVNTHAHAENVLANSAFAGTDQTTIVSGQATLAAMRERCPACLASLTARVGEATMTGTVIVLPTRMLRSGDALPVGRVRLTVMPTERGHTEGDLVLWSPELSVLWAGGLAYLGRVPELSQGSLDGWLAALDHLDALAPAHVVSAAVSTALREGELPEAMRATRAYLSALRHGVLRAMDEGRQPQEADLVPLPAFAGWAGYPERHPFNVQRAWRELEPVWMDRTH